MRPYLALAASAFVASGAVVAIKHRQFRTLVAGDVRALFAETQTSAGPHQMRARWDGLPDPVRKHLRYAIAPDAPAIRTARLKHGGTFRTAPDQRWSPIEGAEYFSTATPGFVWIARLRTASFLWIQARDRLIAGRGSMLVELLSAIAIADGSGPEIDQGSALRWLAESVWFPYALVADGVEWEPIDARSARATLRQEGLPVRAIFDVDADGRISQLHAERYRDVGGGRAVLTSWTGRYGDYVEFAGFRVPSSVEVTWNLPKGPFTYARFRITTLEYNVTDTFQSGA